MVFHSYDGKPIVIHEWTDVKDPAGVVQIAHGMNEYAGRYDRFARALNKLGYVVVADDHRGHGETDTDTLGYAEGDMFEDTLKDMAGIARLYREKYAVKYILFGFSYGSFLTQAFIQRYARYIDAAVIAGSSMQSGAAVSFGKMVAGTGRRCKGERAPARFVNKAVFGGYDKKVGDGAMQWLSTDRDSNERYGNDPQCNFVCSYNFFYSFFNGLSELYKRRNVRNLDPGMPLLLIAGEDDPVGGKKGMRKLYDFYKKHGMKDVELKLIEGSRHEFLNEPDHFDEAFAAIAAFLKRIRVRR